MMLLIIFISISNWVSFSISKNVIIKEIIVANENEAAILVDYMQDIYEDLTEELNLIASNININIEDKLGSGMTDQQGNLKDTIEEVGTELRSVLYSNKNFDTLYVLHSQAIIGSTLSESAFFIRKEMTEDFRNYEGMTQLKEKVVQYMYPELKNINKKEVLVAKINDESYIIAKLDLNHITSLRNPGIAMLDQNGSIIYSGIHQSAIVQEIKSTYKKMDNNTSRSIFTKNNLITIVKDWEETTFVIATDLDKINYELSIIQRRLLLTSILMSGFLMLIVWFDSGVMLKPVKDFNRILNGIYDFNGEQSLKSYIKMYSGNKTIHKRIFLFYGGIFVPIVIIVIVSCLSFRTVIQHNTYKAHFDVIQQTGKNIENKLQSYQQYIKYLMLDQQMQQMLFNLLEKNEQKSALQVNNYFSDSLMHKGFLEKDVSHISIYNNEGNAIYQSNSMRADISGKVLTDLIRKAPEFIITVEDIRKRNISIVSHIRYLPRNNDTKYFLDRIGYLELGIKPFLKQKLSLMNTGITCSSYILDEHGKILADYGGVLYSINELQNRFNNVQANTPSFVIASVQGKKTMIATYPIYSGNWTLITLIPLDVFNKADVLILLYNGVILLLLFVLVYIVSKLLGNRVLMNIDRIKSLMEKAVANASKQKAVNESKYEYEFVVLAHSFNRMLSRLDRLSKELRQKDLENTELENRRNQALLVAQQAQIKPHFLNNIITSIILLLKSGQLQNAINMLVETGKFFKFSLYGTEELIFLEEEIQHINYYINLQRIRFYNQLEYENKVEEQYKKYKVPKFILQPIVENAIEHGMIEDKILKVLISVDINDNFLYITIHDNGKGISEEQQRQIKKDLKDTTKKEHYGLSNVNERLQLRFGMQYGIRIQSMVQEGTSVTITLPAIL